MTKSTPDTPKLTKLPQNAFKLEFAVPWSEVKKTYDHVLDHFVKDIKLKGFRKGKAPKDMVEKALDKGDIYGEVINHLLPAAYTAAVKKHNLKPAMAPQVKIVSAKEGEAWQFEVTSCELPKITLGNYQQVVKGALAQGKLWTPDQGLPAKGEEGKPKELSENQKINLISQALLKEVKVDLPEMMVKAESDRLLSRLLDQVQKLGLSIEQYAASNQKSVEDLKKDYRQTAENSLKLELILQEIANEKKLTASEAEIDKMIAASGDEKIKKQLNSPQERAYISSILRKRQVVDYLINL